MSENEKKPSVEDLHRFFAANLFNLTWELIDKEGRTREDDERMIYAAIASRFHWGEIGTPLEFERGEWMIGRVCALLGYGDSALHHSQRCLEICEQNDIVDFDIAFAYEGIARALKVQGDAAQAAEYITKGKAAAEGIAKPEDKVYFLSELTTLEDM